MNKPILLASLAAFALSIAPAQAAPSVDELINSVKPSSGEGAGSARAKCARLSDFARKRGTRVLVISFEGLTAYSASATRAAYRYQYQLVRGEPAQRPGGSFASAYLANGLLVPLISKFRGKIEVLNFSWSDQGNGAGSAPEACALEWMRVPGRKLVVMGHSWGGDSVMQLMNRLEDRNVMVDVAMTLDAISKGNSIHVTRNARAWQNYYQRMIPPMGPSVPNARVNMNVGTAHISVPASPKVLATASAAIARLAQ